VKHRRAILHVDMDAFYASVEQRDDPSLKGKPVIVGGATRGVVAAASYEVRKYGVHSAMPVHTALRLCPHAICIKPRIQHYRTISRQIFAIFHEFTPLVQGLSLDEAFLDVTASQSLMGDAARIGATIKQRIFELTALTASVGVAPNKLVAKIASDLKKPDGLIVITPETLHDVLDPLSVRRLPGLGRKTGMKVEATGIRTLGELRAAPESLLRPIFGRYTQRVRDRAAGIDDRPVHPDHDEKSISAEDTFNHDISDPRALQSELVRLAERACARARHKGLVAGCVSVKIRQHDFVTVTRQRIVAPSTHEGRVVARVASELLNRWLTGHRGAKLRLLGVALSDLSPATQLGLFETAHSPVDAVVDEVHERFGPNALRPASSLK
jgi:DNA polymerase-4